MAGLHFRYRPSIPLRMPSTQYRFYGSVASTPQLGLRFVHKCLLLDAVFVHSGRGKLGAKLAPPQLVESPTPSQQGSPHAMDSTAGFHYVEGTVFQNSVLSAFVQAPVVFCRAADCRQFWSPATFTAPARPTSFSVRLELKWASGPKGPNKHKDPPRQELGTPLLLLALGTRI